MATTNKYHALLRRILADGFEQTGGKGPSRALVNEVLSLTPADLLEIFEAHPVARRKLRAELSLFMAGEKATEAYRQAGIPWWDYCGERLEHSYPSYFARLPELLARVNAELRGSKNYVLHLGDNDGGSSQAPCLSLIQLQVVDGELLVSAYQRSSDANLGLPADLYHLYLIARMVDIPLRSVTVFLANVHIYVTNIYPTRRLLDGAEDVKFVLNA